MVYSPIHNNMNMNFKDNTPPKKWSSPTQVFDGTFPSIKKKDGNVVLNQTHIKNSHGSQFPVQMTI